jgi:hypothetical protein
MGVYQGRRREEGRMNWDFGVKVVVLLLTLVGLGLGLFHTLGVLIDTANKLQSAAQSSDFVNGMVFTAVIGIITGLLALTTLVVKAIVDTVTKKRLTMYAPTDVTA